MMLPLDKSFSDSWEAANKTHLVLNSKEERNCMFENHCYWGMWTDSVFHRGKVMFQTSGIIISRSGASINYCLYLSKPLYHFLFVPFFLPSLPFFQSFFIFSSCFPSIPPLCILIFPCLSSVALPLIQIRNLISAHFIGSQGSDETPYLSTIK